MYGAGDSSLGGAVRAWCGPGGLGGPACGTRACGAPPASHARRYAHASHALALALTVVDTSEPPPRPREVLWRSTCEACGAAGGEAALSGAALSLSLAKYLQLRMLSHRLTSARARCPHSLHARHAHAFTVGHVTLHVRYERLSLWQVCLPDARLRTAHDPRALADSLLRDVAALHARVRETRCGCGYGAGGEACEDERALAEVAARADALRAGVTAALDLRTHAERVRALWRCSDEVLMCERTRRAHAHPHTPTTTTAGRPESSGGVAEPGSESPSGSALVQSAQSSATPTESECAEEDKKSVRAILTNLLSSPADNLQESSIVCGRVWVEVREGDAGSVIAAALACHHYTNTGGAEGEGGAGRGEHVDVVLRDAPACRVYFASQFESLRSRLLSGPGEDGGSDDGGGGGSGGDGGGSGGGGSGGDGALAPGEESFVRSVARCVPWSARGGKSRSTFSKTTDERFVLKDISRQELQQFVELGAHYLAHVSACLARALPSALARIVGVYGVGSDGKGVLVMENLFYEHAARLSHRFDLKGACRNRLAGEGGGAEAVLLDENLQQEARERPLVVGPAGARALAAAVAADTALLAEHGVMDYSLLLGLRDDRTLVLGLIDYIRMFTWDKKMEYLVKRSLGPGEPTVVSPQQYRARVRAAAADYFPHVPDAWSHLYVLNTLPPHSAHSTHS